MRRLLLLLLTLTMALPWMPTASFGAEELEQAREQRAALQERLDEAAEELAELEARRAALETERDRLAAELGDLRAVVAAADERIALRIREVYKRGSTDPLVMMLAGSDPDDAIERATTISRLVSDDLREVEAANVARTKVDAVAQRLQERRDELTATEQRQRELLEDLEHDLEQARAVEARLEEEERRRREEEERRRREEEERRRAAAQQQARAAPPSSSSGSASTPSSAPAPSSGGMVCPVDRPRSFTDTWGAPRSGGRSHRGTDILAPYGQTVRAIVGGVWDIYPYGRSAGNWAILRGNDGNHYWYLHLQSHQVGDGARVSAGQVVATNGDTGNARGTPHVHFELHPGGGSAINPYPTLRRVCG